MVVAKKPDSVGLLIEGQAKTIAEARMAINDILEATVDQSTKVAALNVLGDLCRAGNVNVSGCSVNMGTTSPIGLKNHHTYGG